MKKTQDKKEQDTNPYYYIVDFEVGDKVWVSTKNQKTQRPSQKLDYQIASLYLIIQQVGHLYKVKLLDSMKIHLVFSLDYLQKAAKDPFLGQHNKPLPPIHITKNNKQEVKDIIAIQKNKNKLQY